jgi:hypothetical protein
MPLSNQTAAFAVCGSSLARATRWHGVAPARKETRTTKAVVRACLLKNYLYFAFYSLTFIEDILSA